MENPPCVLFNIRSWTVITFLAVWAILLIVHVVRRVWRGEEPLFLPPPPPPPFSGPEGRSPVAIMMLIFAGGAGLTPLGILNRIVPARYRLMVEDISVLGWLCLALFAFGMPPIAPDVAPLFVWWLMEYLAEVLRFLVRFTGIAREPEDASRFFTIGYRAFLLAILAYLTVAFGTGALYRANPLYVSQDVSSARDALYFSIVTITTTGYGEILPSDCLRWVAMGEMLMGIFIIVVTVAIVMGVIISQLARRLM